MRRGKEFHRRVQAAWKVTADGKIHAEHTIPLGFGTSGRRIRRGRLDLFVNEVGDYVTVVEIKATDWDRVKHVVKLLGSHRRQVWKYIEKYLEVDRADVCPGIIYPTAPSTPGLVDRIETYLNEYGIQVVWYDP